MELVLTPQPGLSRVPGPRGGKGYWQLNGHRCSGVTTATSVIDKPGLKGWAAEMGRDAIREQLDPYIERGEVIPRTTFEQALAAAKDAHKWSSRKHKAGGTKVDEWVNDYVRARITKQSPPTVPGKNDPALAAINSFLDWEAHADPTWVACQHAAADPSTGIIGISDLWAILKEGTVRRGFVLDAKATTGSKAWDEWQLQISGNLAVAMLGRTLSGALAGDVETMARWIMGQTDKQPDCVVGRADICCQKETGATAVLAETTTDLRDDWENVLRAAGLRRRIPQQWD